MTAPAAVPALCKAEPAAPSQAMSALVADAGADPEEQTLECIDAGCKTTSKETPGQFWETAKQGKRFRCNGCNSWRKRLGDALQKIDEEVRDAYQKEFSPEKKQEFKARNQHTLAKDLPASLNICVEEEVLQWRVASETHSGHFKDKVDLEEKYKCKPEQLAAIFKNADTRFCDVRQCKLWEDPDINRKDETVESKHKRTIRKLQQEQAGFVKKAKAERCNERQGTATERATETKQHTSGPGTASGAP